MTDNVFKIGNKPATTFKCGGCQTVWDESWVDHQGLEVYSVACPFCHRWIDLNNLEVLYRPALPTRKNRGHRPRPRHIPCTVVQMLRTHGTTIKPQINWQLLDKIIDLNGGLPMPVPY